LRVFPRSHSKIEVESGIKPGSTSVACYFSHFTVRKRYKPGTENKDREAEKKRGKRQREENKFQG
jgi:hypothetical protein